MNGLPTTALATGRAETLPHELDAETSISSVIIAVRDEAERLGAKISYETLSVVVGQNADLYREELLEGGVFADNVLMPPCVLRVRQKLRSEHPGVQNFGI